MKYICLILFTVLLTWFVFSETQSNNTQVKQGGTYYMTNFNISYLYFKDKKEMNEFIKENNLQVLNKEYDGTWHRLEFIKERP